MNPGEHTQSDAPPPPFGGAQGAAYRFAQDLRKARYAKDTPEQLLGEGGIGRVVVARETLLRRPVAMKTVRGDRTSDHYEARLIREARITGILEHPSIVPVHDMGRNENGEIFYTMKKVEGMTLREIIEKLRPIEPDMTDEEKAQRKQVQERFGSIPARLGIFQKVCDAVAFAHAHPLRVVHRDLKPENIMVGDFGEVLVMDWGLAKVLGSGNVGNELNQDIALDDAMQTPAASMSVSLIALSAEGQIVGTPMYAAPEQLEGRLEEIDEKSDVYGLGGVLYHLLTLEPPIPVRDADQPSPQLAPKEASVNEALTETATNADSDLAGLLQSIRSGRTAPLVRKQAAEQSPVPEALRPLLLRALEPERSTRISSVGAIQSAITQYLSGFANAFEDAGAWKHFVYFVKRHKPVSVATTAALLFTFGISAWYQWSVSKERDRAKTAVAETAAQLKKTKQQLDRSSLEEGKAWLERARTAQAKGDNFTAAMLAARAVGFHGFGREQASPEWVDKFPSLLGKKFEADPAAELERQSEHAITLAFQSSLRPTLLPIWSSPVARHHQGPVVNSVAFSPDGSRLASGSNDTTVKLWDSAIGKELATFSGHTEEVASVAFSPDGSRLASGSDDKTIKLWDSATGKELATFSGHTDKVTSVVFSPDGSRLASGSDDETVKLWDCTSGTELATLSGHTFWVKSVAFSPDGRRLASGSGDNTIKLWDSATATELATLSGHTGWVKCVTFSPDGRRLASGSDDKTVKLWDSATGKEIASLSGHKVSSLAFSPDGSRLASGSGDNTIKLWDSATCKELATFSGHSASVTCVAFSPDGRRLATGAYDNTMKLWDNTADGEIATLSGHKGDVNSVEFNPDGSRLATGSEDGTVKLWDTATGKELATFSGHASYVLSVAFSPDGSRLASGSNDMTVKLWDGATGKELVTLSGHTGSVECVAFSADGGHLASGAWDDTAKLWDSSTGKQLATLSGHTDAVSSIAFSPDGRRLATGSRDYTVKLWDTATGKELTSLSGHTKSVTSIAFSPDGSRLATGSEDETVKLWDRATGTALATLTGHKYGVNSVGFSPDGSRLATASYHNTVKLWDSVAGKELSGAPDFPFTGGRQSTSANGGVRADAEGIIIRLLEVKDRRPDLLHFQKQGLLRLEGREVVWNWITNPSVFSTLEFTPQHYSSDELAALAAPGISAAGAAALRLRLLAKGGQWRAARAWRAVLTEQDDTLASDKYLQQLYLTLLFTAAKSPAATAAPAAFGEITAEISSRLNAESAAYPLVALPLAQHCLAAAVPERCSQDTWQKFVDTVAKTASRSSQESVAQQAARRCKQKDVPEGEIERLNALIRTLALAHPGSVILLRANIKTYAANDPQRSAAEDRLLALPDAVVGDFTAAAYDTAKHRDNARTRTLLQQAQSRFPADESVFQYSGWCHINLGDKLAALAAFEKARNLLPKDQAPGTDLLAGLALAHWLNQNQDKAIATYCDLILVGRKLKKPQDWATAETITNQKWPEETEAKPMEALRAETVKRHPELTTLPPEPAKK